MSNGKKWRTKDLSANRRRRASTELRGRRSKAAPATKKWKHVYTRSAKVARARQLGFEYPKRTDRQLLDEHVDG